MSGSTADTTMAVVTSLALCTSVFGFFAARSPYLKPMVANYLIHLGLGVAIYLSPLYLYAPDAYGYDRRARNLVLYWSGDSVVPPALSVGKEGWTYLLGAIYAGLGHHPVVGLYVNAVACALIVGLAGATADLLGAPGRRAAWIAALFPPTLFWGSLLLREALVWLCIALIGWALVGLLKKVTAGTLFALAGALGALLWLRGTAAIIIGAAGLLAMAASRRKSGGVLVAVGVLALVLVSPLAQRTNQITSVYQVQDLNQSRSALSGLASSGFATADYSSPVGLVSALPSVLPRVLFGPFPWEWPSMHPLFALDAVVWLLVLVWTVKGIRRLPPRSTWALVLPAIVILLALAVTSGNYGTMQRLRLLSVVLLMPVAAASQLPLEPRDRRRREANRPVDAFGRPLTPPGKTSSIRR